VPTGGAITRCSRSQHASRASKRKMRKVVAKKKKHNRELKYMKFIFRKKDKFATKHALPERDDIPKQWL